MVATSTIGQRPTAMSPGLPPRDRRVVIVSALVAMYRLNELPGHLKKALGARHFGASSPYQ